MVWILTANGATGATLHLPDGTVPMFQVGGTFKFASKYYKYVDIINIVTADWTGNAKGKVQLTVSHGCPPFETEGAWCSPGFWKNASDASWALTGVSKSALFNSTVVPDFYVTPSSENPTLWDVLTYQGKGGANYYGAEAEPYNLNAFNATGAFLTDQITGFHFDSSLIGDEEACPLDHHGNSK